MTFIFLNSQGIISIKGTTIPYPAFAMIGTLLWQIFLDALQSPSGAIALAQPMLARINFPREAIIVAGLYKVVFNFLIRLVLLVGVMFLWRIVPGVGLLIFSRHGGAYHLRNSDWHDAGADWFSLRRYRQSYSHGDAVLDAADPGSLSGAHHGSCRFSRELESRQSTDYNGARQFDEPALEHASGIFCCVWNFLNSAFPRLDCLSDFHASSSRQDGWIKMDDEVLVKVELVSKKFCRSLKRSLWYGVQDMLSELNPFNRSQNGDSLIAAPQASIRDSQPAISDSKSNVLRPDEFWAVSNVSFELRRGECLGLIGPNGAGKTTLLKMLNGLIKLDHGRITMRGRVGALISLGTGFNPILTGRENIYVNGSVLGLTKKEIDERIEDIIDFADIGEFIDTPVQSYSSGMQVRLGFAVATALQPDVLILDEVLAVGDASFRHKCYHRINKLLKNAAVILVSHSMGAISQVCTSVMMMKGGHGEWFSDPIDGVSAYAAESESSAEATDGGRVAAVYPPIRSATVRLPDVPIRYGEPCRLKWRSRAMKKSMTWYSRLTPSTLPSKPL